MSERAGNRIPLPRDVTHPIERQPDKHAFTLHYTGGLRAYQSDEKTWLISPIYDKTPCITGPMSRTQMGSFLHQNGLRPLAFNDTGWRRGCYHTKWMPVVPGRQDNSITPADKWSHIAGHFSRERTTEELKTLTTPTREQLSGLMDARGEAERLAHSISLSLRNIDISAAQIAEFYHEQLVDLLASGTLNGQRSATTLDENLYAHVHAFFMHLGAARDYLAALIAFRLGKDPHEIDAMSRLIRKLRKADFGSDALLDILVSKGYLQISPNSSTNVEASGWLKEASKLRNDLVHTRPYGYAFSEKMGSALPIFKDIGLYRYHRPIVVNEVEEDVLDVIHTHYGLLSALFLECAEASGYDTGMLVITDADIISVSFDD